MFKKQLSANSADSPVCNRKGLVRLTPADLEKLAERPDFDKVLDALGVPRPPLLAQPQQKWSKGIEFNAATFDQAACKQYARAFLRK